MRTHQARCSPVCQARFRDVGWPVTRSLVALAMPKDLTALDDLRFASGCIANLTASRISQMRREFLLGWLLFIGEC